MGVPNNFGEIEEATHNKPTVKSIVYGTISFHGHYFCLELDKSLQGIIDIIWAFLFIENDYVDLEIFYHQWA